MTKSNIFVVAHLPRGPVVHRAHNVLTNAGLERIRDALIGEAGKHLGQALDIYDGASLYGTTGMPTRANRTEPYCTWSTSKQLGGGIFRPQAFLSLRDGSTVLSQVASGDFSPGFPEAGYGEILVSIHWSLGAELAATGSEQIPGNDENNNAFQRLRSSEVDIVNTIANHLTGGVTGAFQEWGVDNPDAGGPNELEDDELSDPNNARQIGSNVAVNWSAVDAMDLNANPEYRLIANVTLPAIDAATYHVSERNRWYVLLLADAIVAVAERLNTDPQPAVPNLSWGLRVRNGSSA